MPNPTNADITFKILLMDPRDIHQIRDLLDAQNLYGVTYTENSWTEGKKGREKRFYEYRIFASGENQAVLNEIRDELKYIGRKDKIKLNFPKPERPQKPLPKSIDDLCFPTNGISIRESNDLVSGYNLKHKTIYVKPEAVDWLTGWLDIFNYEHSQRTVRREIDGNLINATEVTIHNVPWKAVKKNLRKVIKGAELYWDTVQEQMEATNSEKYIERIADLKYD